MELLSQADSQEKLSPQKVEEIPLVDFKLNFESLKVYLNQISEVISQHASILSHLQNLVLDRVSANDLIEIVMQGGRTINMQMGVQSVESKQKSLLKASEFQCNAFNSICTYLSSFNSFRQKCEKGLQDLQEKVKKKIGKQK